MKDYYEILSVPRGCSADELLKAYEVAKRNYSQDNLALYSLVGDDDADENLKLIEEAYEVLSSPEKRAIYHQSFQHKEEDDSFEFNEETSSFVLSQKTAKVSKVSTTNHYRLTFQEDPQMEQEIQEASEYSGEFLQKVRDYKNLSIERMSLITKISKKKLRALEAEEYGQLPAPVFLRGYLMQYAKILKLDADTVISTYLAKMNAPS